MNYTIVAKEIKEIMHQIEVVVKDDSELDDVIDAIEMMEYSNVNEVINYINQIAEVQYVDEQWEPHSEFSVAEIYGGD